VLGRFVGRRAELVGIEGCVAEVQAGHPRLIFIEGPAGIGETWLLAEVAPKLADWRQLTVSSDEAEMRLPYRLLARLLAGVRPRWSAGRLAAGKAGADPFMVGAELQQLLGELQVSGPVAVIVDDAPWADPQSLRALAFALRRPQADRVLAVLTMRPEDTSRLPPGLLHHGQDRGARIRRIRLSTDEVRELGVTPSTPPGVRDSPVISSLVRWSVVKTA
jgi:hypothetical protein